MGIREINGFPRQIVENLSHGELCGLLEIVHYAEEAQTQEDVEGVLGLIPAAFGFPYVCGGVVMSDDVDATNFPGWEASTTRHRVLNISYPSEWMQEYFARAYYQHDLVCHAIFRESYAKTWEEFYRECQTPAQRMVFERAWTYGMQCGVSVGRLDVESKWATFMSCAGCERGEDERLKGVLEYVMGRVHGSLLTFVKFVREEIGQGGGAREVVRVAREDVDDKFSARELEVIHWVSHGKTNEEIGMILGVSERTVKFYVSRLFGKLKVAKRSSMTAKAMQLGLCDPSN